jgi:hypothetical protein
MRDGIKLQVIQLHPGNTHKYLNAIHNTFFSTACKYFITYPQKSVIKECKVNLIIPCMYR